MKHERVPRDYISIHIPILKMNGVTRQEQREKLSEEFIELREAFLRETPERIAHEMQDVIQAFITSLYIEVRTYTDDDDEAAEKVATFIENENRKHRRKIEQYRAERGWP